MTETARALLEELTGSGLGDARLYLTTVVIDAILYNSGADVNGKLTERRGFRAE